MEGSRWGGGGEGGLGSAFWVLRALSLSVSVCVCVSVCVYVCVCECVCACE